MASQASSIGWRRIDSSSASQSLVFNFDGKNSSYPLVDRVTFDSTSRLVVNFIGAPGSGKGTQAGFLRTVLNIPHLSMGDVFRTHMREDSDLGILIKHHISRKGAAPVPEELTVGMVAIKISDPASSNGFILDGFPRSVQQVDVLARSLLHTNDLHIIIYLDIEEVAILQRFKTPRYLCGDCGTQMGAHDLKEKNENVTLTCKSCSSANVKPREEGKLDALKERIREFTENKNGILAALKERYTIHQVTLTGEETPEEVSERVYKIVGERLFAHAILYTQQAVDNEKYG